MGTQQGPVKVSIYLVSVTSNPSTSIMILSFKCRAVSVQSEGGRLMGLNPETGLGLAPDMLGARMTLELNMLDAVGESLQQVSNAERTRAVSMAQQETVALAQILKVSVCCLLYCSYGTETVQVIPLRRTLASSP